METYVLGGKAFNLIYWWVWARCHLVKTIPLKIQTSWGLLYLSLSFSPKINQTVSSGAAMETQLTINHTKISHLYCPSHCFISLVFLYGYVCYMYWQQNPSKINLASNRQFSLNLLFLFFQLRIFTFSMSRFGFRSFWLSSY